MPTPADDVPAPRRGRSRPRAASRPEPPRSGQDLAKDLLQLVLTTPTVEAYLDEMVVLAGGVSHVIAGSGVTVRRGPQVMTITASNGLAAELDEVQYGLDEGPCLSAMETARVVSIEDAGTEQRFGTYPSRARDHGVLSSYSVPLTVDGTTIGALNSYSRQAHGFTRVVRDGLEGFAAQAEVALALTLRAASESDVVEQLQTALHTRSTIDQATGILMAQQHCDADQAFAALRATGLSRRRTVADVAAELVTTTASSRPRAGRSGG